MKKTQYIQYCMCVCMDIYIHIDTESWPYTHINTFEFYVYLDFINIDFEAIFKILTEAGFQTKTTTP